jgi:hypothetical protein
MSIHTAACNARITELLSTPVDSVEHQLAEWIQTHTDAQGRDWCIDAITAVAPDPRTVEVARMMWPVLRDRAVKAGVQA